MRVRGLSLVETVLAMFLLVAEVLVLVGSFRQGLINQRRTAMGVRAVLVAERNLAEVRAWARDPAHFDSNWSPYLNLNRIDPEDPDFQVVIHSLPGGARLLSPCRPLESVWGAQAYQMSQSCVSVRVDVNWSGGGSLSVTSAIAAPAREANPDLQITQTAGPSSPVPPDEVLTFQAAASDAAGQPLSDLRYHWDVKPLTGNASFLSGGPRDGSTIQLKHQYLSNGHPIHASGRIQVHCRAVYHGRELQYTSQEIVLQ